MSWVDLSAGLMWSAALVALWAALSASRTMGVRGRRAFMALQLAIALWSATAGIELLITSGAMGRHLLVARIQYLGITTLPVLWLLFAGAYTNRLRRGDRRLGALWLIPIVTVLGAFTNDFHHLLWTDVVPRGPGDVLPTFVCGPLFWINWTYAYLLIAIGTVWLALSVRHFAGRYRVQLWLLILGVVAPWAGNLLYILGQVPLPGLDMTPVAFAATGACFIAAVFHTKQRP